MIDLLKQIINEGLISLLKNNNTNTSDSKKISNKSKFILNSDPKRLQKIKTARERAREVQNEYKKNFFKKFRTFQLQQKKFMKR